MRKILSLILVAAMLLGGIIITSSVSAVTELENNVAANAYYFDGSVVYLENSGSKGDSYEDECDVKDGTNPGHTLTIDGVIEEGEWGGKAVHVDSAYAASNLSPTGTWLNDAKNDAVYQHPSAENTYFYGLKSAVNDREFSYDLYFMWDEDFLYVAARVNDPYNHQNPKSGEDCWEGDALQFMVDPQGPNSSSAAEGVSYAYFAEHNIFHDTSTGTDRVTYANAPWAGAVTTPGGVMYTPVSNFIAAYSGANSGYTELWDAALRYNPTEEQYNTTDAAGNIVPATKTVWHSAGIAEGYQDDFWADQGVGAYATVRPVNHGTVKNPNYTTDYEIAIPWEMVTLANDDGTFQDTMVAEAGTELGISVACLNASKPGNGSYDSWLGWGSGVCGYQLHYDYQTAGGSNLLTLVSENYAEHEACEHTFSAASCITPETCSKCGYQRGFETGHNYVISDDILPAGEADGSAVATCTVCGNVHNIGINNDGDYKHFGFNTTDASIDGRLGSGWQSNWYDQAPFKDGSRGSGMIFYRADDNSLRSKTAYDTKTFGYAVADCATRGDGLYYSDGSPVEFKTPIDPETGKALPEVDYRFQTGTFFDSYVGSGRYTYKMDFMPTDYTRPVADCYTKGVYNWFGKKSADFMAGLYVFGGEDGTPTYLFGICNTDACSHFYELEDLEKFEENCIVYVEVPESVVKTNEWHQWVFVYDDDVQYAAIYWDGELMVSAYEPQFKHLGTPYVILRRINLPFYAKDIELGTIAYASNFIGGAAETFTANINGEEFQYAAGETVTLEASKGLTYVDENGKTWKFGGWTGDVDGIADVKAVSTTLTMPEADVEINEYYYMIGDLNNDGKINPVDANLIKQMITGNIDQTIAADINGDSKVNAVDANLLKAIVLGVD